MLGQEGPPFPPPHADRSRPGATFEFVAENATVPRDGDLAAVVREIVDLMKADCGLVSLHQIDDGSSVLIHAEIDGAFDGEARSFLRNSDADAFARARPQDLAWARDSENRYDILMLPVAPISGHNQLVISLLFRKLSPILREAAERLYATRRPLAIGYFRLWQQERVSARRVAALEAACDATDLGILLLTRSGRITYANPAANFLLDQGDGLRRHQETIQAGEIGDSVKLQVALNHVFAANDAGPAARPTRRHAPLLRLRRANGEPLIAAIVPPQMPALEPGDVAAMIYIFDPALDAERLLKPVCQIFNLSPVEARLACMLAGGHSITKAATALRIKEQTARGYLKSIFVKTDTNRQTGLVHLLLSNIVRVGRTISAEPF